VGREDGEMKRDRVHSGNGGEEEVGELGLESGQVFGDIVKRGKEQENSMEAEGSTSLGWEGEEVRVCG